MIRENVTDIVIVYHRHVCFFVYIYWIKLIRINHTFDINILH